VLIRRPLKPGFGEFPSPVSFRAVLDISRASAFGVHYF